MSSIPLRVPRFVYPFMPDGYLACFHFGVNMNKTVHLFTCWFPILGCNIRASVCLSFQLGKYLGVEWLYCVVSVCCQVVFQSGCACTFHQLRMGAAVLPCLVFQCVACRLLIGTVLLAVYWTPTRVASYNP